MSNIRHVGIYVDDLEMMKSFYCDNFGFTEKIHDIETGIFINTILGLKHAQVELYKLESPCGEMIELLKYMESYDVRNHNNEYVWEKGRAHIALTVADVDKCYEDMCLQAISFISKPCISPNGNAKVCFCRDPEGNYLELVEDQYA